MTATSTTVDTAGVPVPIGTAPPDVCHLQAVRHRSGIIDWTLDRPLCGATGATRCAPGGPPRLYHGEARCPVCGRPVCPACRARRPGA